mgnify:CR=1 FL=1
MASLCRDTSERFESARTYLTGSDEIDPKWIAYLDFKSKVNINSFIFFHSTIIYFFFLQKKKKNSYI